MGFFSENFLIIAPICMLSSIILTNFDLGFTDFFNIRDYSDTIYNIINNELFEIFNYNNVNNLKTIISEPHNKLKLFYFFKNITLDENLVNTLINDLNYNVKDSATIFFKNIKDCDYNYFENLDLEINLKLIAQLINSIKEYAKK